MLLFLLLFSTINKESPAHTKRPWVCLSYVHGLPKTKRPWALTLSPTACLPDFCAILARQSPQKEHSTALGDCTKCTMRTATCAEAPLVDELHHHHCHTTEPCSSFRD